MKIIKWGICIIAATMLLTGCSAAKKEVKVLILPHFEIGEITGDDAGEAQYFYENYLMGAKEYKLSDGNTLYYNDKNKVALALTGQGKTMASSAMASIFDDERFDFSKTYVVSPGCAGGNMDVCTLGDVCIDAEAVDYDLGHYVDIRDMAGLDVDSEWFHDSSFDASSHFVFDGELIDKAYELTKDIPLATTEYSRSAMEIQYPDNESTHRDPGVVKGTSVTGDNYWKGHYGHDHALDVAEYYKCKYPYTASEMEDVAVGYVTDKYGLKDRTILLRGIVNIDDFWQGDDALTLWGEGKNQILDNSDINDESLDVFDPCMHNVADVGSKIIDAILDGTIQ